MRYIEIKNYHLLVEKQLYDDMFAPISALIDITENIDIEKQRAIYNTNLSWAKLVLQKNDRIVWFMNIVRGFIISDVIDNITDLKDIPNNLMSKIKKIMSNVPSDDIKNLKHIINQLEHFKGISVNVSKMNSIVFTGKNSDQIFQEFNELEDEWKKAKEDEQQYVNTEGDDFDIIISFPNNWAWVNIKNNRCSKEGDAMGHCGNMYGDYSDTIISLRQQISDHQWRPSLTFILDKNGYLGEMKGRANEKPADKYHPYIIALLKSKYVTGIVGGGHDPDNNFDMTDLSSEQQNEVYKVKPTLMPIGDYYKKFGVDEHVKKMILNKIDDFSHYQQPKWDVVDEKDVLVVIDDDALTPFEFLGKNFPDTKWAVDMTEKGYYEVEIYSGWEDNISDIIPSRIEDSILKYVISDYADEIIANNDIDGVDEIDFDMVFSYVVDEREPDEIWEALTASYYAGAEGGISKEIYNDIQDAIDSLESITIDKKPTTGGTIGYYTVDSILSLLAEYDDEHDLDEIFNNYGQESNVKIIEPQYGYNDFDKETALRALLENLPDEALPEPMELPKIDDMTNEEISAEYSTYNFRRSSSKVESIEDLKVAIRTERFKKYGYITEV